MLQQNADAGQNNNMSQILRKLSVKSNGGSERRRSSESVVEPKNPPSPTFAHLTQEEIQILQDVLHRQEQFEQEEESRIRRLEKELGYLEDLVHRQSHAKSKLKQSDLRLCRLCFKNKFADGIGRICFDCHRRVCNKCGSFTIVKNEPDQNPMHQGKGQWRCLLCQKRREYACVSGEWFHGQEARPALNGRVFQRKLSDIGSGTESDWGQCSGQSPVEGNTEMSSRDNKTDTELTLTGFEHAQSPRNIHRLHRRRTVSGDDQCTEDDEEELDMDDEAFFLERQKRRRERLEMHRKFSKKKSKDEHRKSPSDSPPGRERRRNKATAVDFSCQTEAPPYNKSTPTYSTKSPKSSPSPNSKRRGSQRKKIIQEMPFNHPDSPAAPNRFCKVHGYRTASDLQMEARLRAAGMVAGKVRRSSSDGSSLAQCPTDHLQSFLRSDHIDTHSCDSMFVLSKGDVGPESLLNPHLSSFCKEKLSSDESTKANSSPRVRRISRQDAVTYGSSSSVFDDTSSYSRTSTMEMSSTPRDFDTRSVRSNKSSRSEDHRHSTSHRRIHTPDVIVTEERERKKSDGGMRGTSQFKDYHEHERSSRKSDSRSMSSLRSAHSSKSRSTSDLTIDRTRNTRRPSSTRIKVLIQRDKRDANCRTAGLGMRVVGGKKSSDGTLGAFVKSVTPGGPASVNGVFEGDEIIEWNGTSLIDTTFEQTQRIMENSGDTVQLVLIRTRKPKLSSDGRLEMSTRLPDWHPESELRKRMNLNNVSDSQLLKPKRTLPQTPVDASNKLEESRPASGRLSMKLYHDWKNNKIKVTVVSALDLQPRDGPEKENPHAFVKVHLLPDRGSHPSYRTGHITNSKNPEWKTTFVYDNMGDREIDTKSLEITVWDYYPNKASIFLGEVLIDLFSANLDEELVWYPITDHDENSAPLPPISPKHGGKKNRVEKTCSNEKDHSKQQGSGASSDRGEPVAATSGGDRQPWNSLPVLPATPAHDRAKEILHNKRVLPVQKSFDGDILLSTDIEAKPKPRRASSEKRHKKCLAKKQSSSTPALNQYEDGARKGQWETFRNKVKRRMSDVVTKVGAKLADKRSLSEEAPAASKEVEEDTDRRHSHCGVVPKPEMTSTVTSTVTTSKGVFNVDLLSPPVPLSRARSGSASSSGYSPLKSTTSESDLDESLPVIVTDVEGKEDALGPGQIAPKPTMESTPQGEVCLGFIITKGQLEIDVMCARGLSLNTANQPPDTYVKTCLMEGTKRIQRKKTKTFKYSQEPLYHQKIKYSAVNVHGRCMQVQVKEKGGSFDKNPCLGVAVVKLDNLDLSKHTSGWYKLFLQSALDYGSAESLGF